MNLEPASSADVLYHPYVGSAHLQRHTISDQISYVKEQRVNARVESRFVEDEFFIVSGVSCLSVAAFAMDFG